MKPQSYPFMNIANKYGLDYGDVLMVADYWRKGSRIIDQDDRTLPALHNALEWPHEALGEITFANADFRRIKHGHIDWNTGEPIPLPRWIDIDPEPEPVMNYEKCADCDGTGSSGKIAVGPCVRCAGLGRIYIAHPVSPQFLATEDGEYNGPGEIEPEPGEHAEIIHALDYRNHDEE